MITFKDCDFPNLASHCNQGECGFSIYRGVLILWDEDHDQRILGVIDKMPARVIKHLLIAQEHEGCIDFVWNEVIPKGYESDAPEIEAPDGDLWGITSVALIDPEKERDRKEEYQRLMRKCDPLWKDRDGYEELLTTGETRLYITEGAWIHPCGRTYDEDRGNEPRKPRGRFKCSCSLCKELRAFVKQSGKEGYII